MSEIPSSPTTSTHTLGQPPMAGPSKSQQLGDSLVTFLNQSARAIKSAELSRSLFYCGLSLLAIVISSVIIDHWIWQLNRPARYLVWISFLVVAGWWGFFRIFPLLFRRIHPAYAAKQIEASMPELKNSLMNWLQLSQEVEGTPRGVLAAVGRFAAVKLHGQEASSLVDYATPVRLGAFFFGLLVILAAYMMLSPKSGLDTVRRIMAPWSNVAAPSRSRILSVSPGDAQVTLGSRLNIRAEVRGILASEGVQIIYETTDGSLVDQVVDMEPETTGMSYVLAFGGSTQGIQQPMRYRVRAGDAEAGPFSIQVQSVPLVVVDRVEYIYPAYTNMKPRLVQGDGHIEALEGTQVKIHASANQPMAKSRIEFDPIIVAGEFKGASSVRDLETAEKSIHGEWLLRLDEKKSNPTLSQYRIRTTNTLGVSNAEPVIYGIRVLADLAPEIRLENDHPTPWLIPANATVPLELRAVDPDFGLCQIALKLDRKGESILNAELLNVPEGVMGNVNKTFEFCPKDHGLKTGDKITLVLQVKDNRHRPGSQDWEPNVVTSNPIEIEIGTPETKPAESEKWSNPTKPDEEKKPKKSRPKEATPQKEGQEQKEQGSQGASTAGESGNSSKSKPNEPKNSKGGSQKGNNENPQDSPNPQEDSENDEGDSSDPSNNAQKQKSRSKPSNNAQNENQSPETNEDNSDGDDGEPSGNSTQSTKKSKPKSAPEDSSSRESDRARHDGELMEQLEKLRREMAEKEESQSGNSSDQQEDSEKQSNPKNSGRKDGNSRENKPQDDSDSQKNSDQSSSERQSGDKQSGDKQSGDKQSGDKQSGDKQSGDKQSGDKQSGDKQSGDKQSGDKQSGDKQSGDKQSGDKQSGDKQSGDKQSGDKQSGDKQSGDKQSGDKQSGDKQSGDKQSGDKQSGDEQSGDKQSDASEGDQDSSKNSNQDENSKNPQGEQAGGDNSQKKEGGQEGEGKGESQSGDSNKQSKESKSGAQQKGDGQSGGRDRAAKQSGNGDQGEQGDGGAEGDPSSSNSNGGKESSNGKPSSSKGSKEAGSKAGSKGNGDQSSQSPQSKSDANGGNPNPNGKASKSDGSPGEPSQGRNQGSGGGGSPNSDAQNGQAGAGAGVDQNEQADAANLEYTKKATDMVLDFLKRQRDQPDPELLRRMGWSKADMQAFLDRWEKAKEEAARDPNKKRELDESLRALGLAPPKGSTNRVKEKDDQLQGMREAGTTYRPPETLRLRWDSFRKAQQREKKTP